MHFEQMSPAVEPHLEEGMGTRRASKSFAITIDVPLLETTKPFADQREAASKGMAAAVALQRWFEKNKTQLVEIVRDIEGKSGL
ncbi:MAG: hypothetical protein KC964_30480 [Candidatus Omnitrophica bacterium]|nr:hypothetical protein [Candidatus Omnitrophota bacterium]